MFTETINEILKELTCPISHKLFVYPITILCCYATFSKKHILEWINKGNNCPNCNSENVNKIVKLKKNLIIDNMIEHYLEKNHIVLTEEQKDERELEKKIYVKFRSKSKRTKYK